MTKPFVHLMLFQCPRCGDPISTTLATPDHGLEEIDLSEIKLTCHCRWTGKLFGVNAKSHIVVPLNESDSGVSEQGA
jgi:hypothetical protein